MCCSAGFDGPVHPLYFPFTLQQKLECITEFNPWFAKETAL